MLSLVSLFALAISISAQPVENKKPRTFRVITSVGSIGDLKFDQTPHKTVTLNIRSQLSDPIVIPESKPLVLYREIPPPPGSPPETPPTKETMATVSFPKDFTQAILIIIPAAPSGYRAVLFKDDRETHPAGAARVFNLSGMAAAIKVNKDITNIDAGKTQLIPYPLGPNNVNIAVNVQRGGSWAMAFDKGHISRANIRVHVFIFDYKHDAEIDDGKGPPAPALVRFYTESVPPTPSP